MSRQTKRNLRTAQIKSETDKSIYITLPIEETGISPGDSVMFETVKKGTVILHRLRKEDIEESKSIYDKLVDMLGIGKRYELKDSNKLSQGEQ